MTPAVQLRALADAIELKQVELETLAYQVEDDGLVSLIVSYYPPEPDPGEERPALKEVKAA